jgi:hypothetical protein
MFKRRSDATVVREVPAYRRMMPFLMRTRTESAVYFDLEIDLTETDAFIEAFNAAHKTKITVFHVITWATVRTVATHPKLNRFTAGGRLWQRKGIWISYSAKKRLDNESPIVLVKKRFDPDHSLVEMLAEMTPQLAEHRSDKRSYVDKELDTLLALPPTGLSLVMRLQRMLDSFGLLPSAFIDRDPLFASFFIANLGSVGLDAAYHHLYEYGTIPIFCVVGRTKETAQVVDGEVQARKTLTLRYSYDERIEDGLYAATALQTLKGIAESPWAADGELAAPATTRAVARDVSASAQ